jgi:hypothetical protein
MTPERPMARRAGLYPLSNKEIFAPAVRFADGYARRLASPVVAIVSKSFW